MRITKSPRKNFGRSAIRTAIFTKKLQNKYCVGCELEKTESELEDGCCPSIQIKKLEIIDEENYFFTFSKFQKPLLELYGNNPNFVVPVSRLKEIKTFVGRGLEDFSISRLKRKMPWELPFRMTLNILCMFGLTPL